MDCGVDAASEPEVPDWCPVLVIVPVSIVDNWVKAFQTWGHFAVEVLDNETNVENFNGGVSEVLICKHSLIMMEAYVRTLTKVNWRLVVVDEIHNFKNHKARLSTHFRELRKEVELRTERVDMVVVGLTGTLMQNNHKEFWNVIHLVQPDLLGSWNAFQNRFANPIKMAE
jgi:SNF2 family DNA or RNA helicase